MKKISILTLAISLIFIVFGAIGCLNDKEQENSPPQTVESEGQSNAEQSTESSAWETSESGFKQESENDWHDENVDNGAWT